MKMYLCITMFAKNLFFGKWMFPLNGMRSQLKERLCLFLIRKQQLISYMLRVL